MLRLVVGLALLVGHGAVAAEVAKASPLKVAVLPIKALGGVKQDVANVVTEQLASAIQNRNYSVMSPDDLAARLGFERQKQLLGCTDTSCLIEVGSALGVDRLVSGTIAFVGQSVVINLALINNASGTVEYRYSERVKKANDEAFLDLVPKAAEALFPPPASTGVASAAPGSGGRVAAWVTGALAIAAVGAGIASFAVVTGYSKQLQVMPTPANAVELQATGYRWLYGGIAAYAAAGALAITSLVLFLTSSSSSAAPAVSVVPSAQGATFVVGGHF